MKWKAKPKPEDGDERRTLRFAWLPVRCKDGYWRWLCDVYPKQRYVVYGELAGASWVTIEIAGSLP